MISQNSIIQRLGGYDKTTHFFASAFFCMLTPNWLYALILAVVLAFGKEMFDKYIRKQAFDWRDVAATVLGGMVSAGILYFR